MASQDGLGQRIHIDISADVELHSIVSLAGLAEDREKSWGEPERSNRARWEDARRDVDRQSYTRICKHFGESSCR